MHGIGDTIYARPFIKMLVADGHDVYLKTPLPFMFEDLDVKFVKIESPLRAQNKYLKGTSRFTYVDEPEDADKKINYFYTNKDIKKHGIVAHMEEAMGYEAGSTQPIFGFPPLPPHGVTLPTNRKIAIVRPVTHRKEWLCTSRSPQSNYVPWCSKILMDMGYHVISIADNALGEEWIEPDGDPMAHQKFHQGELGLERTFSLMKSADLVVGGAGFIVPAAIAAKTNLFILFGGRGSYDNPHKLLDFRMDLTKIGWAMPTNFCRCRSMDHKCDKEIKDLDNQFFRFMQNVQTNSKKLHG
jgi:hypothetical protein